MKGFKSFLTIYTSLLLTLVVGDDDLGTTCDFESDSICDWSLKPEDFGFRWRRLTGDDVSHNNQLIGPNFDFGKSPFGHFLLADSDNGFMPHERASLSKTFDGSSLPIQCIHFWYYVENSGKGIGDFKVETITAGVPKVEWVLQLPETSKPVWNEGQVEVRSIEQQNYTVLLSAGKGNGAKSSIAIDQIHMWATDACDFIPKHAFPIPDPYYSCDFEPQDCQWQISSFNSEYQFVPTRGQNIGIGSELPSADFSGSNEFFYLGVEYLEQGHLKLIEDLFTEAVGKKTLAEDYQCMTFWYTFGSADAPLVTVGTTDGEQRNDEWILRNPTRDPEGDLWVQGQVLLPKYHQDRTYKPFVRVEPGPKVNAQTLGHFAIDEIKLIFTDSCPIQPWHANPDSLSDLCTFEEENDCGWQPSVSSSFRFKRTNAVELGQDSKFGPPSDLLGDPEGFFMNLDNSDSVQTEDQAAFVSPIINGTAHSATCFKFWYRIEHNNSLESFALSQELTNELGTWTNLWSLNKIDSVDQWLEGQVHVTSRSMMNYKLQFTVVKKSNNFGYVTVDEFHFGNAEAGCDVRPVEATPDPIPITICNFDQQNVCDFENSGFDLVSGSQNDGGSGPSQDWSGNPDTFFLQVTNESLISDDTPAYLRLSNELDSEQCLEFWFSAELGSLIDSVQIKTIVNANSAPQHLIVWDLVTLADSGNLWQRGRVNLHGIDYQPLTLVIEVKRSNGSAGYFAIDDLTRTIKSQCPVSPPETEPNPETSYYCSFESDSHLCDWQKNEDLPDQFEARTGRQISDNPSLAAFLPPVDVNGSPDGWFMTLIMDDTNTESLTKAELKSPSFSSSLSDMPLGFKCLHFWFYTQSPPGMTYTINYISEFDGQLPIWKLPTTTNINGPQWQFARARIANHDFLNYSLSVTAAKTREALQDTGYFAIDDIALLDSFDCSVLPEEALPEADATCSFEHDLCQWEVIHPNLGFSWRRKSPQDLEDDGQAGPRGFWDWKLNADDPDSLCFSAMDLENGIEGYFLYATAEESEQDEATFISPDFDTWHHASECFSFWYFVEFGSHIQNLSIETRGVSEISTLIWRLNRDSGAEQGSWQEGRVLIQTFEQEEEFFQVLISVTKSSDQGSGFVALDDFAFLDLTANCHISPVVADPKGPVTCSPAEFQCSSSRCVPQDYVCNFRHDCPGGEDEETCPSQFKFNDCDTLEDCHWHVKDGGSRHYELSTIQAMIDQGLSPPGPTDSAMGLGTTDVVVVLKQNDDNLLSGKPSKLISPQYRNTRATCYLSFWYFINGPMQGNDLILKIKDIRHNMEFNLDYLRCDSEECGWRLASVTLGRQTLFSISFELDGNYTEPFDGAVAIDEVNFELCDIPTPKPEPCQDNWFKCRRTEICINPSYLCDLQDDCGDGSDEDIDLHCSNAIINSFEKSFGIFETGIGIGPNVTFGWSQGSGATVSRDTGPAFDHTFFDASGHYLYIDSLQQMPGDKAWLVSKPFRAGENCRFTFWYHMRSSGLLGKLNVWLKHQNGSMEMLASQVTNNGNAWTRLSKTIGRVDNEFQIVFEGIVGQIGNSDIALDDVVFRDNCLLVGTGPCDGDRFQCKNGDCLDEPLRCNFRKDCLEGEDEEDCPALFDFEHCGSGSGLVNVSECLWDEEEPEDSMNFVITSGKDIISSSFGYYGPFTDYKNDTEAKLMFLVALESEDHSSDVASVVSPVYRDTDARCTLEFWYYIDGDNGGDLVVAMKHLATGEHSKLDFLKGGNNDTWDWKHRVIGLGRQPDRFQIMFVQETSEGYAAGVALDDIQFRQCGIPFPADSCLVRPNKFWCQTTKVCIQKQQLCDLQDDCGDGSDESVELCGNFTLTTDFGEIQNGPSTEILHQDLDDDEADADFLWVKGRAGTVSRLSGPAFDHSTFGPRGHYMFVMSQEQRPKDKAVMISKVLEPTQSCHLSLWYHMLGNDVGQLNIYQQMSFKHKKLIQSVKGSQHNRWNKMMTVFVSEKRPFRVLIEAVIGRPGLADIAIDDVAFLQGCSEFSGTFYQPIPPSDYHGHGGAIAGALIATIFIILLIGAGVFYYRIRNPSVPLFSMPRRLELPNLKVKSPPYNKQVDDNQRMVMSEITLDNDHVNVNKAYDPPPPSQVEG